MPSFAQFLAAPASIRRRSVTWPPVKLLVGVRFTAMPQLNVRTMSAGTTQDYGARFLDRASKDPGL